MCAVLVNQDLLRSLKSNPALFWLKSLRDLERIRFLTSSVTTGLPSLSTNPLLKSSIVITCSPVSVVTTGPVISDTLLTNDSLLTS